MNFDESKHPRDEDGKFTDGNGTSGSDSNDYDGTGKTFRQNTSYDEILGDKKTVRVSKSEYAIISSKVAQLNANGKAQRASIISTANNCYLCEIDGTEFVIKGKFDIERNFEKIKGLRLLINEFNR